ncbi:hypothetical protein, partial [Gluconobacter aidae]|uniref:hypothetical protein n=1 Tax=Gluconobacter aidae TaxID=2662454 RepID=UPI001E55170A
WTTPHHKNSYAVSFAIDIRNPSQQGFVIHSVALRNPEGTDLAYPGTGRVKDQAPLEIDFDCPPGLRTLQLYAEGAALVSAKSLSITAIFSSRSRDIRCKDQAINVAIQRLNKSIPEPIRTIDS